MQTLSQLRKSIPAAIRPVVESEYRDLLRLAEDEADRPNMIRRTAWHFMVGHDSGSAPFWRHGFVKNYGRRVERSDYTALPRYDLLRQSIAFEFEEFAGPDGEDLLFSFLFSTYKPLPDRAELYAQAIAIVEHAAAHDRQAAAVAFDFGANVQPF